MSFFKITYNYLFSEIAVRSRVHEIQEDWKPSFLSNEEFTHLILEVKLFTIDSKVNVRLQ